MAEKSKLQKALEATDRETRSYSGRGMYGKSCLAFTVDSGDLGEVVADLMQYVAEKGDTDRFIVDSISDAFRNMSSDSMGMGSVYYFKRIPYVASETEEDEGEEECPECGVS